MIEWIAKIGGWVGLIIGVVMIEGKIGGLVIVNEGLRIWCKGNFLWGGLRGKFGISCWI